VKDLVVASARALAFPGAFAANADVRQSVPAAVAAMDFDAAKLEPRSRFLRYLDTVMVGCYIASTASFSCQDGDRDYDDVFENRTGSFIG
jgi:hypothetical protein